jgi:hypothetical protein
MIVISVGDFESFDKGFVDFIGYGFFLFIIPYFQHRNPHKRHRESSEIPALYWDKLSSSRLWRGEERPPYHNYYTAYFLKTQSWPRYSKTQPRIIF